MLLIIPMCMGSVLVKNLPFFVPISMFLNFLPPPYPGDIWLCVEIFLDVKTSVKTLLVLNGLETSDRQRAATHNK